MRIGLVDLDTSHPQNWIPILREMGHEIVGVWDGGSVHPPDYVQKFAEEREIPRVYTSLEEMKPDVDSVILHGCDWDSHVEKARPFVEADKSVLIDKPLAGNLRDLHQLSTWVRRGARILGGSSLRFCAEAQEWLARPVEERGTPQTVFCGCGVDEFNYGIHAYSMLSGLMGSGIARVRHLNPTPAPTHVWGERETSAIGIQRPHGAAGAQSQDRIQVTWHDGRIAFLMIGSTAAYLPFYATVVTERSVTHLVADNNRLYRALLEAVMPYLAGETETPPLPFSALIEPELCALAARRSWLIKDREIALDALREDESGYNGAEFAAGYRKMRYPQGA